MKLTLNRREELKGLFFKRTEYYLDIDFGLSNEEVMIIKKHKWETTEMVTYVYGNYVDNLLLRFFLKPVSYPFKSINDLSAFEQDLIEAARALKNNLSAADGFTDVGPREIEL